MAKRLAKYEVTYENGETRVKQLTEGDAERLGDVEGVTVKKRTPQGDKKRTPQGDKKRTPQGDK